MNDLFDVDELALVRSSRPIADLLTFPWVGSTAAIGHFWAAADAGQVSDLPFACPQGAPRLAGQGWPKAIAARRVSALDA